MPRGGSVKEERFLNTGTHLREDELGWRESFGALEENTATFMLKTNSNPTHGRVSRES